MRVFNTVLAVTAVSLSLLTACGQDEADDTSVGLDGQPIKIGQIAPRGTSVYNSQDSVAVAKAAIRGVNERGGIDGRPLELVYCNDKNDPNTAAACAREMVTENVVAMVRSIAIAGGDQVSAILGEAGIPDVGRAALAPAEFSASNAYLLDGSVLSAYAGVLQYFADNGGESVFLTTTESASATTTISNLEKIARELDLEVAGISIIGANTADYAPLAAKIKDSGAGGAVLAFPQQPLLQTIKAADQNGMSVQWLLNGGGFTEEDLESLPAAQTAKFMVGTGTVPLSAAETDEVAAQMRDDIEAQFEAGDADADPKKLFTNSLLAWEAVFVLAALMPDMETIDASAVRAALEDGKDLDTGISAPWTPTRPGPTDDFSRVSHPFVHINAVEDSRLVLLPGEPLDVGELLG